MKGSPVENFRAWTHEDSRLGMQTTQLAPVQPLHLNVGQVPMSLYISEETLWQKALMRYQEFIGGPWEGLKVVLQDRPCDSRSKAGFFYKLDDASISLRDSGAEFYGVRHEYALDSLLRILLTTVLLPERGFLLHAASVVRDGQAHIFFGRSGAGKSTISSLSPKGSVLTDEISLLRYSGGAWQAYGTPFWGEFRADGINRRYPIAGIYSLIQASEDRVVPVPPKEIVRALLPCVLFFNSEPKANDALLQTIVGFARQVPCYRLHFRRDASFWEVIPQ
ncbi:MAG: hypothetical protein ACRD4S_16030 [Candidatus Acidiferrales bacterium]